MKTKLILFVFLLVSFFNRLQAQVISTTADPSLDIAHSVLPVDGIVPYLPKDSTYAVEPVSPSGSKLKLTPMVNFFFRPEVTSNYKEAGLAIDTGNLNFYLRGDFGAKLSLPKNVDMVFNLQSYGTYTRALGPLDPNLSLYEAYVDMKKLDRQGKLSLRFGRMCLGKYGTEIVVGDDDFIKGRSFESVRLRYRTKKSVSDLMWVQLYQQAPDSANFDWNHPIFLGNFNTFNLSQGVNFDVNLPFIIDQYNSGLRTTVLMPDVRFFGQQSSLRYSAEFIYQTGSAKGILNEDITGTLSSYAAEASLGIIAGNNKFTLDVSYYRASGDEDPTDTDIKSYNVLWQNEHRRFGFIDAFKGSNVQSGTLHLDWKVGKLVSTGLHGVFAQVVEPGDRSTGIVTIGSLNSLDTDSKSIGMGGDWYLNFFYNHNLNFQFSASVFSPGDYFTAVSGLDKLMTRVYVMMALRI